MKPGSRARAQLCDMRRELIGRLDRAVTGDNLALLASVQSAIVAIDASGTIPGRRMATPWRRTAFFRVQS
jgi:hypothetical protein